MTLTTYAPAADPETADAPAGGADLRWFFEAFRLVLEEGACECRRSTRFGRLVETARLGVVVYADGAIRFANRSAAALIGVDRPEDLVGRIALDLVAPTHRDATRAYLRDATGHDGAHLHEVEVLRADGSAIWVGCMDAPIEWEGGPARLVALVDATAHRVARRSRRAAAEQARRLEAVGRLAGGLAHEFNNKLTAILGHAQLALMTDGGPHATAALHAIVAAAQESGEVTQRLLAFGRRQLLQPRPTDVNDLVGRVATRVRQRLGLDVTLRLHLMPGLPRVTLDVEHVERALVRLALRSRDAEHQPGAVSLATGVTTVLPGEAGRYEGGVAGRQIYVRLSDDGPVPGEEARRILGHPYGSLDVESTAGLDLASAFGLIRQTGGWLRADGAAGRGSSLTIHFPVRP